MKNSRFEIVMGAIHPEGEMRNFRLFFGFFLKLFCHQCGYPFQIVG